MVRKALAKWEAWGRDAEWRAAEHEAYEYRDKLEETASTAEFARQMQQQSALYSQLQNATYPAWTSQSPREIRLEFARELVRKLAEIPRETWDEMEPAAIITSMLMTEAMAGELDAAQTQTLPSVSTTQVAGDATAVLNLSGLLGGLLP